MQNIYLVGFMGSGKSTIAKKLSSHLAVPRLDTDEELSKREQLSIAEIFASKGEEYFRSIEHQLIAELSKDKGQIIATGGGTPCFYNNMELMKLKGTVVYLKMSPQGLFHRLEKARSTRPLLAKLSDKELLGYISAKLEEREAYYAAATHTINSETIELESLIELLQLK